MGALDGEGEVFLRVGVKLVDGFAGDGFCAVDVVEAGPFFGKFKGFLVGDIFGA